MDKSELKEIIKEAIKEAIKEVGPIPVAEIRPTDVEIKLDGKEIIKNLTSYDKPQVS